MPEQTLKLILDAENRASDQVKDLENSLKGADSQTKTFKMSLADVKAGIDMAMGAAKIMGSVFKTAFDLTMAGAELKDTTESLDRMASKAGIAAGLLDRLTNAAGGTVDDMDLAASTIRMFTGESDAMVKKLGDAAPQLITIARAAEKLNPTLSDTADIYDAITRALETGQTRGLKPYGFEIDQTATKQEQLNQVLEQGNRLIEQVGGDVSKSSDSVARFSMLIDDAKDAVSLFLANGLLPIIDGFFALKDAMAAQTQTAIDNNLTWEEYLNTLGVMEPVIRVLDPLFGNLAQRQLETAQAAQENEQETTRLMNAVTSVDYVTQEWTDNLFYANQALELQADNTYLAYTTSEKFADRLQLVNDKAALMTEALQNAQPPVEQLMDTLDQDISSPLSAFIDDLQFFIASGGQDFQGAFEAIKNALASNQITADEAQDFSGELLASIENVKVAAGEITLDEAAQNIADTLNVSLEDALKLLQDVGTAADVLTNVNREISMDTSPLESAYELMMNIENSVDNITGTHNVHFDITTSGDIPSTGGNGAPTGGSGSGSSQGFASGTDGFIVPPGYPNDSYMVGLTSGEEVVVRTPAQQQAGGGGGVVIQNLIIYTNASDPRAVAQEVGVEIGRQVRLGRQSGVLRV